VAASAALFARGVVSRYFEAARHENLRATGRSGSTGHAEALHQEDMQLTSKDARLRKNDTRPHARQALGSSVVPGMGGFTLSSPTPTVAQASYYTGGGGQGYTTWSSGNAAAKVWGNNPNNDASCSGVLIAKGQIRCQFKLCSFYVQPAGPPGYPFTSFGVQILESGTYRFRQYMRFPTNLTAVTQSPSGLSPPQMGITMFFYLLGPTSANVNAKSFIDAPSNVMALNFEYTGSGTDSFVFDFNSSCNAEKILQISAGQVFCVLFQISCAQTAATATTVYFNPTMLNQFIEDLLTIERLPCVAWL